MRPVDRALLIYRARQDGEETAGIARRFGLSAVTVRRLLAQLDGASSSEVATLKAGDVNLAVHAVIARHVSPAERTAILAVVARSSVKSKELEALFVALGWRALEKLGAGHRNQRKYLLTWACLVLDQLATGSVNERLHQLARKFPLAIEDQRSNPTCVAR
jgi:hypothetical protein